jgi:hypothetical protein
MRRPSDVSGPFARGTFPEGWRYALALLLVAGLSIAVYSPTLRDAFLPLGFDDSLITENPAIRGLGGENLRAIATGFTAVNYVPLAMLSLAADYHLWGLDPFGYHLTNVLLHAGVACLFFVFAAALLETTGAAILAALIFALHPLQMEAVSVAFQRKTLLASLFFFLTLILYQRWRGTGRAGWYAGSLFAFVAAGLAKPIVVTLPALLLLYDEVFVGGRRRWADKLPFVALAVPVAGAAMAAHASVGAIQAPHGGSLWTHVLMVSRATLEEVVALFLPVNLSPLYYYPRSMVYDPLNFLALILILSLGAWVIVRRRRDPWSFFCLGWFAFTLAPDSNVLPLAQLRADRFLYLPMAGFALWVACLWERAVVRNDAPRRLALHGLGIAAVAVLGFASLTSASVWRDDVTAWTRVVERHPWCGIARHALGVAYLDAGAPGEARREWLEAARLDSRLPAPHLFLARLYAEEGRGDLAELEARQFIALAPDDPEGPRLLEQMREPAGS